MKRDRDYEEAKYKYRLRHGKSIFLAELLEVSNVETEWYEISDGWLHIHNHYSWDGPSGPTRDDASNLRGSLIHDVLYQALREGTIHQRFNRFDPEKYHGIFRKAADGIFHRLILQDGMPKWRARYYYLAVRWFGRKAAARR